MNRQLTVVHILLVLAGFFDQPFGQTILLPVSDHPADHISAEDVDDHIEIKVGPFDTAF